jgi:NAD(P)-dependent dehydrogenase (short-subunit alcohol dehydrogenase family)
MAQHPALTDGRVAVVIGAASGIGLAAAKRFASMGLRICLARSWRKYPRTGGGGCCIPRKTRLVRCAERADGCQQAGRGPAPQRPGI